ncbi:hypothetical protein L9F63_023508, partial [Diploptera punctata]
SFLFTLSTKFFLFCNFYFIFFIFGIFQNPFHAFFMIPSIVSIVIVPEGSFMNCIISNII